MYSQKEIINVTAIHLLNLAIRSLMISAFKLASETEPWAVKGLHAPDYVFEISDSGIANVDLELELLGLIEDQNVVLLMKDVHKIITCRNSFINLNGVNFLDYIADEELFDIADDLFVEPDFDTISYEERVNADCKSNYILYLNLWRCAEVLATEIALIEDEKEVIFDELIYDYLQGIIESDNSNAQLVLDLIGDIGRSRYED
jgi:hypothetical protein